MCYMVVSGAGKCDNEIGEPMVPIALATGILGPVFTSGWSLTLQLLLWQQSLAS